MLLDKFLESALQESGINDILAHKKLVLTML